MGRISPRVLGAARKVRRLPGSRHRVVSPLLTGLHGANNHRNMKVSTCLQSPGHYLYSPTVKKKAFDRENHLDNRKGLEPHIYCNSNCNKNKIQTLLLV